MKPTGIVRNIDELGRLVVPKEMRTMLGIDCNEPVEIIAEGDRIILTKYVPDCLFCGSHSDLVEYKGRKICPDCLSDLKKQ